MSTLALPTGDLPKAIVPSVLKAARLLEAVAASPDPLTLAALRHQLDLPKSSILSLCTSLTVAGLLRRYDDGGYHLGARVVDLAHAYLSRTDLPREFAEAWATMPAMPDDGAVLAVRDGTDAVYIGCRNGAKPLGLTYRVGMRLPASCTATGKSLLSTLSDDDVRAIFSGGELKRMTPRSCPTVAALLKDLQGVRARGYAIDDEEAQDGAYCVGVPIREDGSGPAIAAVAVSMVKGGKYLEKSEAVVAVLQALAGRLSHRVSMLL